MRKNRVFAAAVVLLSSTAAHAETSVSIGMSGWTGFAPLTLAKAAGIFEKNGLKVDIKKIPQASRHLALASGDIQCAATTVETWVAWNANGVKSTQIFQMDKSHGADGMVVRSDVSRSLISRAKLSPHPHQAHLPISSSPGYSRKMV